ncbi:hypothetical protein [Acinetobacter tandoii]|uniref:Uncharacterized protein n=1 Tax=Acinetobacter tandoii DSM 14970 = CIP 107469 TaxID=1120927 RepID=R9B1D4_9GAMM|nr:hypothetical protein [Acinetobacter tandoii]EOR08227.1 hypothetical protein I593_01582 [Acinetobacter tandoii DSM 14970 = CIP 107469]
MLKYTNCEKCEGCKIFDGKDGTEARPCHQPVPTIVVDPIVVMSSNGEQLEDGFSWLWFYFTGIGVGMLFGYLIAFAIT